MCSQPARYAEFSKAPAAGSVFTPDAERPLRIVHIDTGKHWRGSQHQIIYSMEGQMKRGHDVLLICPPRVPLAIRAGNQQMKTVEIPMHGELDPLAIGRIARVLHTLRPHVVHLQSAHAHILGGIAARITGVPAVILSRRLDNPLDGALCRWKHRHFYDMVIAVSEGVKQVLEDSGATPEFTRSMHSAAPDLPYSYAGNAEAIRAEFRLKPFHLLVTTLAHVEPRKGIDTLIDAMSILLKDLPGARALVVGGGSYLPVVKQKAADADLKDKVIFTGYRDDIADILAASDLVVSPSYLEGCSNALLEAMAVGKPVVGTKVGGTPEIITHWVNGLLIPPGDPEALAWAIARVLSDEELAAKLGEAGRWIAKEKFSVDRMVDQTLQVYYEVLEKRFAEQEAPPYPA